MSRSARRAEARMAAPYQAQIPRVRARVESTNLAPILARIEARRQFHDDLISQFQDWQRSRIADGRQQTAERAGQRANLSIHPGTSSARVREQWNLIWTYYRAAQLVTDRLDRMVHARTIRDILIRNEIVLQHLHRSLDPDLPRIADLQGVIVREETARAALGSAATASLERETPDAWGERPWVWEGRAWDVDYLRQQQLLRDRQQAQFETRITIPRPFCVMRPRIQALADHVVCMVLPPRD